MSHPDQASREARFEDLYRSTATDLLAFLTRRASDPEEATDILAEVYLIAWRRLDSVPTDQGARLWLFGVARNLIMKDNQRERSHQALVHDITQELARLGACRPETTDGRLAEKTRACLEKLPAKQREVLLLNAWDGLKPREIAKMTGSTANLVRVRLHHARRALARELRPSPALAAGGDEPASEPLRSTPTTG
jgi:RNA polymerase sigma factor (sigma-70 family)